MHAMAGAGRTSLPSAGLVSAPGDALLPLDVWDWLLSRLIAPAPAHSVALESVHARLRGRGGAVASQAAESAVQRINEAAVLPSPTWPCSRLSGGHSAVVRVVWAAGGATRAAGCCDERLAAAAKSGTIRAPCWVRKPIHCRPPATTGVSKPVSVQWRGALTPFRTLDAVQTVSV